MSIRSFAARRFILVIVQLLYVAPLSATPRYWGIDHLGGARYADVIVSSHPDGFALGIFTQADLFGDAYPVVDAALSARKIPLVRYNLRWSDTHTFTTADFPAIVAEAKRFVSLVDKYPEVECQFSGATEHQLNATGAAELARLVLDAIPTRCKYVNNPWQGKGALLPAMDRVMNEVHGTEAHRPEGDGDYNFSFDGSDAFDSPVTDLKERFSDADVFFFWTSQNNGLGSASEKTPRPERKLWPTVELLKGMAFLANTEGTASLPAGTAWNPKSKQTLVPPGPLETKPYLQAPATAPTVDLVTDDGRVIAVSQPREDRGKGQGVYRFDTYGYVLAEKSMQMQGKPTVGVRFGADRAGDLNPAFPAK